LEILIDDPWINEGHPDSPIQVDLASKSIEEDDAIIKLMETKYRIDRDTIIKSLRENLYDDVAAIYYHLYFEKESKSSPTGSSPSSSSSPSNGPLSVKTNGPPQATPKEDPQSAMAALPTQAPRPPASFPPTSSSGSPHGSKSGMGQNMIRIDEDAPLPPVSPPQQPASSTSAENDVAGPLPGAQARPLVKAKPRKRRFTVGGEADMQKMADEDEEGSEMLKQLQNQPKSKDDGVSNVAMASALPPKTAPSHGVPGLGEIPSAAQNAPLPSVGESQEATNVSDAAASIQTRKRHNTIVGLLRNTMRRQSDVSALVPILPLGSKKELPNNNNDMMSTIPGSITNTSTNGGGPNMMGSANTMESSSSNFSRTAVDENGHPRSLRFTFNSNTTSSKPPDEIIGEVVGVCDKHGIQHKLSSRYLVECFWTPAPGKDGVKFEIEVCKLPRLKNLHGLRFKRVSGSSSDYKDICEKVLGSIVL
jgi:MAP/microtubule affinity-regulating kinase